MNQYNYKSYVESTTLTQNPLCMYQEKCTSQRMLVYT